MKGQPERERAVLDALHGTPRTLRALTAALKARPDWPALFAGNRNPDAVRSLVYATAERLRGQGHLVRYRDDEGTYMYATPPSGDHQ